jgi:diacylglycerol kinase
MFVNLKRLIKSFAHAFKGLYFTLKREQNFRLDILIAIVAIAMAFYFPVGALRRIVIVLIIATILVLELVNSVLERIIDIMRPRIDHTAKNIKDMMSAVVLIVALAAIIIGILIFWPYLFGG